MNLKKLMIAGSLILMSVSIFASFPSSDPVKQRGLKIEIILNQVMHVATGENPQFRDLAIRLEKEVKEIDKNGFDQAFNKVDDRPLGQWIYKKEQRTREQEFNLITKAVTCLLVDNYSYLRVNDDSNA
ncbi:MAG: hypothetical protein JO129_01750 [Candidatus Dependentiae bacterium]|nr:hypothetical protein [Candidatus Dependentiae bacterium]